MKTTLVFLLVILMCHSINAAVLQRPNIPSNIQEISKIKTGKALEANDVPVRVQSVQFDEVSWNGTHHLAVGVIFTKEIDPASVQQNLNIRLLKEENGFWVDVSTQGNVVRIMQKHISWLSGAPLETGSYRIHLRGTIKDKNGLYLDCNNDGIGEGGNLPAYDSQIYSAEATDHEDTNSGMLELIPKP